MKQKTKVLSVIVACLMMFSITATFVSALTFQVGDPIGSGTVASFTNPVKSPINEFVNEDEDFTYSYVFYNDKFGNNQAVHVLEVNPVTSNYMPYVYSKYTGVGATIDASAIQAEEQFGANVVAGVNATFFAMNTGSTYAGYWVHDGRLAQATLGAQHNILTFGSDGRAKVVDSRLDFKLFHNGREIVFGGGGGLVHINKKSLAEGVDNRFYYWDTECGVKTDSVIDGLEILCQKQDFGELIIGGTLKGKVLEIREDSKNSPVGPDEFVLYVKNASPLKTQVLPNIAIGDIFEISVEETIEASKPYTENANASIVAQYPIIKDGELNTAEARSQLGDDFMNARAQRTTMGIKEDGTVILLTSPGRKTTAENAPGLTVYEEADIMYQLGCVYALNLDGGGSTQMIVKQNGELVKKHPSNENRRVANCLFFVERQESNPDVVNALQALIAENNDNEDLAVVEAIQNANDVLSGTIPTMPGDVVRVYMNLQTALSGKGELDEAMAAVSGISHKNYSPTVLQMIWDYYEVAANIRADENASAEDITLATRTLKSLLDMTGTVNINLSQDKPYTKLGDAYPDNPNYVDTDDKELTDGFIGDLKDAYGPAWVGFHKNYKGGTENGKPFYDVTIDLLDIHTNLSEFVAYTEHDWGAGIEAPTKVEILVSDDGETFTSVGIAIPDVEPVCRSHSDKENPARADVILTLSLTTPIDGRYVKFHMVGGASANFMFVTELEVYKEDSPVEEALYVTGFNSKILANNCYIFTPDYAEELDTENANLNWARAIVAEWDEEQQEYIVTKIRHGSGPNTNFTTVPENGFILGVHGDDGEGTVNKAYASTAKIGDKLVLHGINILEKTALPGCYITIEDAAPQLKPGAPISLDEASANGVVAGQTATEISNMFTGAITIKDTKGNTLTGDAVVGTGFTITVGSKTYTVVVVGDINGDGIVNANDYLMVRRAFLGTYDLNEHQTKAAIASGGAEISARDYMMIKRHFLGSLDLYA